METVGGKPAHAQETGQRAAVRDLVLDSEDVLQAASYRSDHSVIIMRDFASTRWALMRTRDAAGWIVPSRTWEQSRLCAATALAFTAELEARHAADHLELCPS
jgi:hypothetical protein